MAVEPKPMTIAMAITAESGNEHILFRIVRSREQLSRYMNFRDIVLNHFSEKGFKVEHSEYRTSRPAILGQEFIDISYKIHLKIPSSELLTPTHMKFRDHFLVEVNELSNILQDSGLFTPFKLLWVKDQKHSSKTDRTSITRKPMTSLTDSTDIYPEPSRYLKPRCSR
jgi:hypothetical protein